MAFRRFCLPLLLVALTACGQANSGAPPPRAGLADTEDSQKTFRELERQWVATALDSRAALTEPLTRFVQSHPTDGKSRRARLYLAWLSLRDNRLGTASRWLDLAQTHTDGVDGDLLEIVDSARLLANAEPFRAYAKLKPLEGRLLNSDDRLLYFDQMLKTTLRVERYSEALQSILDLAIQSVRRHRDVVWANLETVLEQIPLSVLKSELRRPSLQETALTGIRRTERSAAHRWLQKQIRARLSRAAIEERDVGLAQRLVSNTSSGPQYNADEKLQSLAREANNTPRIEGRAIGLVLDLSTASRRQQSIELSTGLAVQLRAAHLPVESRVALFTRSVQDTAQLPEALRQLAGEGAALLVAGWDSESADAAVQFAETEHLALLLLHPESKAIARHYVRLIGTDFLASRQLLRQRLEQLGAQPVIELGPNDEDCPEPGVDHEHALLSPVLSSNSLSPGMVLAGSSGCSQNALELTERIANRRTLGVGLASLSLLRSPLQARTVVAASTGLLPWQPTAPSQALSTWITQKSNPPTWFEALGHDIAIVAEATLPDSPSQPLLLAQEVRAFHEQLLKSLDNTELNGLWTTRAQSFAEDGSLPRQYSTVPVRTLVSTPGTAQ